MAISKSFFFNNSAEFGGVIYNEKSIAKFLNNNICVNNSAFYGNVSASYGIRLSLKVLSILSNGKSQVEYDSIKENGKVFTLQHEFPGVNLQRILFFEALDHFNQTVLQMSGRFINS